MVWLIQVSAPASSPWGSLSNNAINFTAPYFWMSLSLNISMTIAICARLLFYRRRITRVLGPNHGTQYTSVAAMIVESSFLYSAFALLFLIPFALNNPIQNAFIQLMGEIQVSIAVSTVTDIIMLSYPGHRYPPYHLSCGVWCCLGQWNFKNHP